MTPRFVGIYCRSSCSGAPIVSPQKKLTSTSSTSSAADVDDLPDLVSRESASQQPAEATWGKRLERLSLSGSLQSTVFDYAEVLSPDQCLSCPLLSVGSQCSCTGLNYWLRTCFQLATSLTTGLYWWAAVKQNIGIIVIKVKGCCGIYQPVKQLKMSGTITLSLNILF